MYKEKIINLETDKITWRDYTPEEIAKVEAKQAEITAELEVQAAKEAARSAVLEKLGLTSDEAAALLG
jgi:hypothetical protein